MSKQIPGKNKKTNHVSSGAKAPKPVIFLLGFFFILVGIFGVLYNPVNSEATGATWTVSEEGILSFPQRGEAAFTVEVTEDLYAPESEDSLKLLTFESRGENVRALLRIPAGSSPASSSPADSSPANSSGAPGIVLLPGAGISKEKEQGLAVELSKLGYATLTLDQRNLGAINPEGDLELYKAGLEPLEYKMVYDALKATDVLSGQPEIDPEKLAIVGESNGGRFAIIACALAPSLRGVVGISTAGYGTGEIDPSRVEDPYVYSFYRSIDPDTYLSELPPARFVLLHSFNDTVIPHEMALGTFSFAGEPKAMYNVSEVTHGYTASMHPYLEEELALIFID
ncbi:alpha/beta superfamily [Methanosarcina sp. MTP4]|uniref:alpha/beta hydrolase family protein n=1 Tax=Methanosarcina sp. MTP4 TaxID=1434100 RepID=UPI0006158168|nr:acetylxylan esterase [Methanosarcina sp. MTP4]AKB26653.1 alpha/beta superfamily [Methanosarcina sp. MTP4]